MLKKWQPEVFQGSLHRKPYFEGWFLKNVTGDGAQTVAIIVGISLTDESSAFIQINTSDQGSFYLPFPLQDFQPAKKRFFVQLGGSSFSLSGLKLQIPEENISGEIQFHNPVPYPVSLFRPGIMGPFALIPGMECYHGVVSVLHRLSGSITIKGRTYRFDGGRGYIEKDWGRSMPKRWIWLQANTFPEDVSVMLSLASVPFLGGVFDGFLCYLYEGGRFYTFNTYNLSRLTDLEYSGNSLRLNVKRGPYLLEFFIEKEDGEPLKAPVQGKMERTIKENLTAGLEINLSRRGVDIFHGETDSAAIEIVGDTDYHIG